MAGRQSNKNAWVLFLLLLVGVVLGSFIGNLAQNVSWLEWLNYGKTFVIGNPFFVDLHVIQFTFGIKIYISISSILGVVIAIFAYRKI